MHVLQLFSLPLLTKELIEQAQSKRTYILRVVYAAVLYGMALWQYHDLNRGGAAADFVNLGRGRALFQLLIGIQSFAILILVPAITCGALTVEKEKDTLALLLLTKLTPSTIVFEKFLSRVFAMGTYQLLSLPLFAIVYGTGGVELPDLLSSIVSLMALTVIVGSISILCSTWFRTTSEAFIMAYVALIVFACCVMAFLSSQSPIAVQLAFQLGLNHGMLQTNFVRALAIAMNVSMATFVISGALLLIASRVLVQRAFVPPRNILLEHFQRADRFFTKLNDLTTGGIVLVSDRETLPEFEPITWRETRKKSLGTFRYQFRILMLLLTPLILAIAAVLMSGSRNDFGGPFRGFPIFFWFVSMICLTVHSTGVIPAERIRQTLDVLLVSPLTAKEIVLEKLSGVRRLIKILTVPFAVLVIFQAIWSGYVVQGISTTFATNFWLELVATSVAAIVYMPLIMWIGFQFGLRTRTQIQAVLSTFATVAAISIIPLIVYLSIFFTMAYNFVSRRRSRFHAALAIFAIGLIPILALRLIMSGDTDMTQTRLSLCLFFLLLGPLQIIFDTYVHLLPTTTDSVASGVIWPMLSLHFGFYGCFWWWIRQNALTSFSRIVKRLEPDDAA